MWGGTLAEESGNVTAEEEGLKFPLVQNEFLQEVGWLFI